MAKVPSRVVVTAKAQHEPQLPWSLMSNILFVPYGLPVVAQLTASGMFLRVPLSLCIGRLTDSVFRVAGLRPKRVWNSSLVMSENWLWANLSAFLEPGIDLAFYSLIFPSVAW